MTQTFFPFLALLALLGSTVAAPPQLNSAAIQRIRRNGESASVISLKKSYTSSNSSSPIVHDKRDLASSLLQLKPESLLLTAMVEIGSPPNSFELILDTGSSDIWITSNACDAMVCGGRANQDLSVSSTYKSLPDAAFTHSYGAGLTVNGVVITETVALGNVVATQQVIGLVTGSTNPSIIVADGTFGLGPKCSQSFPQGLPFIYQTVEQKAVADGAFTMILESSNPSLFLGGIHPDLDQNQISYNPVVNNGGPVAFWQVPLQQILVDNTAINEVQQASIIIDSGTPYMNVPKAVAYAIHSNIPNSKYNDLQRMFEVPCDCQNVLNIVIGGVTYSFQPIDYILVIHKPDLCASSIMISSDETYLFGEAFMSAVAVVFDLPNNQVGLARWPQAKKTNSGSVNLSPADNSGPPESNTEAPVDSTGESNEGNTESPVDNTESPDSTGETLEGNTESPVQNTESPDSTGETLEGNTESPVQNTESPVESPEPPANNPESPPDNTDTSGNSAQVDPPMDIQFY